MTDSTEYCSLAQLKQYLGIAESTDDVFLTSIIARAQKMITTYTGRLFAAPADSEHRFASGTDTDGRTLWFDDDLCQFASTSGLIVNADAEEINQIELVRDIDFVTIPRNTTPWYGVKLLGSASKSWEYTNDPEMSIVVTGRWAYSITAPDDIVQACLRLAAYIYRQKDAQVFETTAIPDAGVITIPIGIPKDVKMILDQYVKAAL